MPYSAEVYLDASMVLAKRRRIAEREADLRKDKAYEEIPDLRKLDVELAENLSKLSIKIMQGKIDSDAVFSEIKDKNLEFQKKQTEILLKNGLSADYLQPHYSCRLCSDTGRINGKLCQCYKDACLDSAIEELERSSINAGSCSFDNFDLRYYDNDEPDENGVLPKNKMPVIFEFCKGYAGKLPDEHRSILMLGKTGLGKTHLSLAIASAAVKCGLGVVYSSAQHLISELENEHFSNEKCDDALKKYCGCDFLIIDDLGAEFITQFSISVIGNIVNERLLRDLPTIISTNLSLNEIKEKYSERTASRIFGCYEKLKFIGRDIRIKKR